MKFRVHMIYEDPTTKIARRTDLSVTDDLPLHKAVAQVRGRFPKDAAYFELWHPATNELVYTGDRE